MQNIDKKVSNIDMYEDIIYFSDTGTDEVFHILLCGISYCDGSYRIDRPASPFWCMEYIVKGKGYVSVNGKRFVASAGDVYILPRGDDHYYYSDAETPWEKVWFNIGGDFVGKAVDAYRLSDVHHVEGVDAEAAFRRFVENARAMKAAGKVDFNRSAHDLLSVLQTLSAHRERQGRSPDLGAAARLREKIDAITDYRVSFEDLTAACYATKSHLIRVFREAYGVTPYEYLLRRKLAEAEMLLENTSLAVRDIADRLGFDNTHYFSTFFRKKRGVTPTDYRKRRG